MSVNPKPAVGSLAAMALLLVMVVAGCGRNNQQGSLTLTSPLWAMFRHDPRHTGLSPFDTSANTGTQKWELVTGGEVNSSPAVGADGTIYVGSFDDNVYALNPDSTLEWEFATGG